MNPSYKRDMEHNYMILESPAEATGSEYQIRMLLTNQIPGLLRCNMRTIDGILYFYYEITSKQPLSRIFELTQIKREDIRQLLTGIKRGIDETRKYLLDTDYLILKPEYIYMEPETREVYLCCLPFYEGEIKSQFRNLAEFMLKNLDHSDEKAVVWGYEIYSGTVQENYSLENVLQSVYRQEQAMEREVKNIEIKIPEKLEKIDVKNDFREGVNIEKVQNPQKKSKGYHRKKFLYLLGGAILTGLAGALSRILGLDLTQTGGVVFLLIGLLIYLMGTKNHGEKEHKKIEVGRRRKNKGEATALKKEIKDIKKQDYQTEGLKIRREEAESIYVETDSEFGETVILSERPEQGYPSLVGMGETKGEQIFLKKDAVLFGKLREQVDVLIPKPDISRIHAKIGKSRTGYCITDLNSKNGTYLNGIRLNANEQKELKNGDQVYFASVGYFFEE